MSEKTQKTNNEIIVTNEKASVTNEAEGLRDINADYTERYGFHDAENYLFKAPKGLTRELVEKISEFKSEPQWMREFRLKSLDHFLARDMPTWGSPLLSEVDFDNIHYFVRASERPERSWDDVPEDVKKTFDRLGIPEAERNFLAGVGAQYESEVVYHQVNKDLEDQGVIFLDMDSALRDHEDLVREYFATIIPANDNKLASLNSAVWSGGSFVYVPPGVQVEMPLQAYFRINTENMGQFERTIIIADKGSYVHYVEGCHLAGAMVKTEDGEVSIEELSVGDNVLTHKDRFRPVTKTMSRPVRQDIHSIQLQGEKYRRLQVTPGHPFLAVKRRRFREHNRNFEPQWLEAHQLEKGDYLAMPLCSESLSGDISSVLTEERGADYEGALLTAVEKEVASQLPGIVSGDYLWIAIASIKKTFTAAKVYNLSVADDESYIADGVVSHNCTAPTYSSDSLHSAVVELIAKPGARIRYTTVQNWSQNVFNLVTKRAVAERDATVEWVDCNLGCLAEGSQVTTIDGPRPIELLEPGDLVMSWNEEEEEFCWRPVIAKRYSGEQPVRPVEAEGNILWVTDNHPFYCLDEEGNPCYRRADQIDNVLVPESDQGSAQGSLALASLRLCDVVVGDHLPEPVRTWDIEVADTGNFISQGFIVHNSKLTMKYPSVYLMGERAHGEILSIAFAGKGQHQDAGGKIIHVAPNTTSNIFAKSISKDGGRSSYRGLLEVAKGAIGSKSKVVCDALLLDEQSRSDTYPTIRIGEDQVDVGHEATVSKVGDEQLFYLMSHGISEEEAGKLIVNGFIEPIVKELPMEYAVEMNRLIELQMEGSIG